jgi:outer membrane protein assembly factor BamE
MRQPLLTALLLVVLASGCNMIYKPEVQQGVLLSPEMLANLKPGMTKRQVRLLLGSAPISDAFHPERWDYVYYVDKSGQQVRPQRLTLFFQNDFLTRAEGDLAPAALVKAVGNGTDKATPESTGTGMPH